MAQRGPEGPRMAQRTLNGPKWLRAPRMAHNGLEGPKWPNMAQRAQNGPKWPRGQEYSILSHNKLLSIEY